MGEGTCADTIPWPGLVKSAREVCQLGVIESTEEKLVFVPPFPWMGETSVSLCL